MSQLESIFHRQLDQWYPRGKECCFYEAAPWSQLCHLMPQSKVNRIACEKLWGIRDLIDLPVINVLPGSYRANHGSDMTTKVRSVDERIVIAARCAVVEWLGNIRYKDQVGIDLEVARGIITPINALFRDVNHERFFFADIIEAQEDFQNKVRNAFKAKQNA